MANAEAARGLVLRHARRYGRAKEREIRIMDQVEEVRGLDEFDPKHCTWETRLFRAQRVSDTHRDRLLRAAYQLATGTRFGQ